jgi:hypothetical protein
MSILTQPKALLSIWTGHAAPVPAPVAEKPSPTWQAFLQVLLRSLGAVCF